MDTPRRPWVAAAALMLLGALAAGGSAWYHWLPCRGSMLSGSVLHAYAYGPDFSDACLRAMDTGFAIVGPTGAGGLRESGLGVLAGLLLASAWVVGCRASGWARRTPWLAWVPVAPIAATCVLGLAGAGSGDLFLPMIVAVDGCVLVAFLATLVTRQPGVRASLQAALVLGGCWSVGFVPGLVDYSVMSWFSDANWDSPPGSGAVTVAGIVLAAFVLLTVTLVRRPRTRGQAEARDEGAVAPAFS